LLRASARNAIRRIEMKSIKNRRYRFRSITR
jgi:hypothetical protein